MVKIIIGLFFLMLLIGVVMAAFYVVAMMIAVVTDIRNGSDGKDDDNYPGYGW